MKRFLAQKMQKMREREVKYYVLNEIRKNNLLWIIQSKQVLRSSINNRFICISYIQTEPIIDTWSKNLLWLLAICTVYIWLLDNLVWNMIHFHLGVFRFCEQEQRNKTYLGSLYHCISSGLIQFFHFIGHWKSPKIKLF